SGARLGRAPVDVAQRRLEELFGKLEGIRDAFGTSKYYGWLQLQIVEAVVLAVASEDFLMGAEARRWLDDDEFLIRRRIHRDVKAMMGQGGGSLRLVSLAALLLLPLPQNSSRACITAHTASKE